MKQMKNLNSLSNHWQCNYNCMLLKVKLNYLYCDICFVMVSGTKLAVVSLSYACSLPFHAQSVECIELYP